MTRYQQRVTVRLEMNLFVLASCIKAHRKLAVTKNHVIKSKDEMPTVLTRSDPCIEICADHKTEIVKFYCEEHDCVGCGDCMVLEHKSCKVQLIANVSSNYGKSEELIRIRHKIDHLKKNLASCKHEIKCSLEAVDEMKAKVIKEIKIFRKEMNIYLDQVETDLIEEVEELTAKDVSLQKKLQEECESLENELGQFQSKLDQYSEKVNQLFATSKRIQKRLKHWLEVNQNIASGSQINICRFEPSKEMMALKTNHSPLGNIGTIIKKFPGRSRRSIVEMEANLVGKTNVQAAKEGKCWITGMAMVSCDDILLADCENSSLKILNVSNGKVTSRFKPPGKPYDVTVINSEKAATTLPKEGKILFVNT
ncbi:E3 ubiquitin-protein ligase TRIM33-like [Mercenaria mercenaria]|uniref:E3 ubiquitin-protein ligase TRIM33-like n=1 Tax=Mercenaria mercenaria TaxID=6596 RepID=UPI00234EEB06|nr:E3 ubiquitin-protein ligase TRIM33-like [Mercenaria mercenaria]